MASPSCCRLYVFMDIPKQYDPKQAEKHHYEWWERNGFFAPEINKDPDAQIGRAHV